jgi:hypothetical protein
LAGRGRPPKVPANNQQPELLTAMSVYRLPPVKKKQTKDFSCWAACLESWTHTTKLANLSETALLKYYGQPSNGGLNNANLTTLCVAPEHPPNQKPIDQSVRT